MITINNLSPLKNMLENQTIQPLINQPLSDFELEIYHQEQIRKIKLSDYRGKWLILFFYPADFTFICPTELEEMAGKYDDFQKLGAEIISVSTDTVFVHKAWHDNSAAVAKIKFPMAADPSGKLCRTLGIYLPNEGLSLRATFIIAPEGIIQTYEVHNNNIGRSAKETLRKLQAASYVREHGGEVCPAGWQPGAKTLKPSLELVGKI